MKRCDHHAVVARAVLIQHAEVEQICVRRDALERPESAWFVRRAAVSRDDARYVRAVSEIICQRAADKALPGYDAALARVLGIEITKW